jgi:hypothetical protein
MGTSLSGLTPADTYPSLIKVGDNSALSATLKTLSDGAGNDSPLKLSTTAVQIVSPLRISTDDPSDMYLDCEDGSQNNRFNITRNISSQQVNLNFASNPAGSTTIVGAVRTYRDGTNLSNVMTFREDGYVVIDSRLAVECFQIRGQDSDDARIRFTPSGGTSQININSQSVSGTIQTAVSGTYGGFGILTDTAGSNTNLGTTSGAGGGIRYYASLNASAHSHIFYYNLAEQMRLSYTGNLLIGSSVSDTARLSIKGSGLTSATTSLLVQNSSGTQAFKIDDNLTVVCSGLLNVTSAITSTFLSGGGTAFTVVDDNGTFIRNSTWNFNRTSLNAWIGGAEEVSSLFTLNSTTKGFLPPRMTTTQINAIVSPAEGLVAYNTTISHLCCYQAGAWQKFNHSPM